MGPVDIRYQAQRGPQQMVVLTGEKRAHGHRAGWQQGSSDAANGQTNSIPIQSAAAKL